MIWNHRVIRHVDTYNEVEDIWFGIHEVFYSGDVDDLKGALWTEDAIQIIEGDAEDLLRSIVRIKACLDKPILMIEDSCLKEWKP